MSRWKMKPDQSFAETPPQIPNEQPDDITSRYHRCWARARLTGEVLRGVYLSDGELSLDAESLYELGEQAEEMAREIELLHTHMCEESNRPYAIEHKV